MLSVVKQTVARRRETQAEGATGKAAGRVQNAVAGARDTIGDTARGGALCYRGYGLTRLQGVLRA
jgi:hypothetical protein